MEYDARFTGVQLKIAAKLSTVIGLITKHTGCPMTLKLEPTDIHAPASVRRRPQCSKISETAWPIKAKFCVGPLWVGERKFVCVVVVVVLVVVVVVRNV